MGLKFSTDATCCADVTQHNLEFKPCEACCFSAASSDRVVVEQIPSATSPITVEGDIATQDIATQANQGQTQLVESQYYGFQTEASAPAADYDPEASAPAADYDPEASAPAADYDPFDTVGSTFTIGSDCPPFAAMAENDELAPAGLMAARSVEEQKRLIKDFARTMVKGRDFTVVTEQGGETKCRARFGHRLDTLKVRVGDSVRQIELEDILEVVPGNEVDGIRTPLTKVCATVVLSCGECITFRLDNLKERDAFVCCLIIFSQSNRC